jgi:serine protease Do
MQRFKSGGIVALAMGVVAGLVISSSLDWMGKLPAAPRMSEADYNKGIAELERQQEVLATLADRAKPCVVTIYSTKTVRVREDEEIDPFEFFFGPQHPRGRMPQMPHEFKQMGQGSGVIVGTEGKKAIILTNSHVAGSQDKLRVKLSDGREFDAKLRGADPKTDIAVIEINASDLPTAKLGNSSAVEPGHIVMAIGSPFGLEQTITVGHVSAMGRRGFSEGKYEDYIQTDAAINPGNSGGPLINLKGEAIGINTLIFSRTGIFMGVGFAIPSNKAKAIMDELLAKGKVTRAWLGIRFSPLPKEAKDLLKLDHGVQVNQVLKDTPADKAGMKDGDILLEFNNAKINDVEQFRDVVASAKVGSTIPVKILRGNKEEVLKITLSEQPADLRAATERGVAPEQVSQKLGMTVQELTPPLAEQLGYQGQKGLVVTDVEAKGPAANATPVPIKEGELILEVARQPVKSMAEFQKAVGGADLSNGVLMLVRSRDATTRYVVLKTGE